MAVTDRPMFAPRVAPRDRQSGAVGGAGITGIYSDPSGAIMRPVRPPLFPDPRPLSPTRQENMAADREGLFTNALLAAAQEKVAMAQQRFANDPSGVNLQLHREAVEELRRMEQESGQFQETYVPGPIQTAQDRGVLDVEGPESIPPETLDIFNNLGRAAETALPEVPPRDTAPAQPTIASPLGPSGMEQEARRTPVEAARAALGLSGMEEEARGQRDTSAGPLVTNPTEVAAGLNDPNKAVREKTAADFAKEFMDMAPKYEGTPKHLLLAQIGFAIAAGDSPNAMQNIADGLLAGSEAFVRDNAAKSEFDRQLKLSAMQYGLQELGKERERGRPALRYVALTDTTYKGRDIPKGGTVLLSLKDIEDNGGIVPAGFGEPEVYTALAEKEAAVHTMLQDEYDRGVIDDETLLTQAQNYTELATRVAQTQRALDYFEQALFTVGEDGNLTGYPGALRSLVSKAASFAGVPMSEVDALAEAGKAQELTELLTRGVLSSVPVVLEGQSANSISNFDVENAIKGLVSSAISEGSMTRALTNETALIRQIQDSMRTIEGARQRAFAGMSYIEKHLTNRFTKAGDYYAPAPAIDVLEPIRQSVGLGQEPIGSSTFGDIVVGEDGVWKLVLPGS